MFETGFIEHAYIEPEAGYAERIGDRVEVQVTTQSPHMDRIELEQILGLPEGGVRIKPTAVGGGFGSKLDLSVQPYLAIAAWKLNRPVRLTYTRPESMMSTTKRHPSRLRVRIGATGDGRLTAMDFTGEFNTGAYASWGPTVANRVPVHASGPYVYDAYRARTAADPHERAAVGRVPRVRRAAVDDRDGGALRRARRCDRRRPARVPLPERAHGGRADGHRAGVRLRRRATASVSRRSGRTGSEPAPTPPPRTMRPARPAAASASPACGTGAATPPWPTRRRSRSGLRRDGRVALYQGAVDMGQGANTVMTQICADALGIDMSRIVDARRRHRHHARRRQEFRVAPDVHLGQRDLPGLDRPPRTAAAARGRLR